MGAEAHFRQEGKHLPHLNNFFTNFENLSVPHILSLKNKKKPYTRIHKNQLRLSLEQRKGRMKFLILFCFLVLVIAISESTRSKKKASLREDNSPHGRIKATNQKTIVRTNIQTAINKVDHKTGRKVVKTQRKTESKTDSTNK